MGKIRVAVAGVGNCASALLQGIEFYRNSPEAPPGEFVPGLMNRDIGGYLHGDIEVVAAFDIDRRKVGRPVSEAIFSPPNCTKRFVERMPDGGPVVRMAPPLDGVAPHMAERGELVFYSGTGLINSLVKKVTKSKWSYVGWVYSALDVENTPRGVLCPQFRFDMERCAIVRLGLDPELLGDRVAYAENKPEKNYGLRLLFKLLWRRMFGWRRRASDVDWCTGYTSATLVAKPVFMFTGVQFNPDVAMENIIPEDVWQFVVMNPSQAAIVFIGTKVSK